MASKLKPFQVTFARIESGSDIEVRDEHCRENLFRLKKQSQLLSSLKGHIFILHFIFFLKAEHDGF